MIMHWVYVLKSDDGHIYVGETTRLYRRFNEHQNYRGGVNTSRHNPTQLIGLYSVGNNTSFLRYYYDMIHGEYNYKCGHFWGEDEDDYLAVENLITERYMYENREDEWSKVRGGKYCTSDRCISFYAENLEELKLDNLTLDRPLCRHGYPCEVNMKTDKSKIYFTCPLSRPNNWQSFYSGLDVEPPCNFWEEFKPYRELREKHSQDWIKNKRQKDLRRFIEMTNDEF
jgi:predicted GIY-YIG superfamily endonuclease